MIDKMLEAGTMFDWITPLWTFVQDWRNRPSSGFTVATDGGWSANAIQELLTSKGIKTWGWQIIDGVILFRLRAAQADWAVHVMDTNGVPWVGSSAYKRPARRRKSTRRPTRRSTVIDFFNRL